MVIKAVVRVGGGGIRLWRSGVRQPPSAQAMMTSLHRVATGSTLMVLAAGFLVGLLLLQAVAQALPAHNTADELGVSWALILVGYLAAPFTALLLAACQAADVARARCASSLDWLAAVLLAMPLLLALFIVAALAGMQFLNQFSLHLQPGLLAAGVRNGMATLSLDGVFCRALLDGMVVVLVSAMYGGRSGNVTNNAEEDSGIGFVIGLCFLGTVFAEFVFEALTR